ncbi:M56 family metallopeptidase [Pedobacter sp. SAFR-022]|uniref:M56 family metallopeptidase n=1 Tax=Pedobacter sp. SAFR-022 TaxID=3436861 RepID=UPI003F801197
METFFNTIISAFGWSMFHSLWQGAVIYGLLFLILMAVPRITARLKHNLAFGAIALMFASFLLTFVSILKGPSGALTLTLNQQVSLAAELAAAPETAGFVPVAEHYFPYLVALYGLGVIVQIIILWYSYQKLELVKHAAHDCVPPLWQEKFQAVLLKLNIAKPVLFKLSDKVNVPLVIGFFKPIILFPVSMATQLDLQQVEAILIHELSHVRRNDFLLNLIKTAIETVLFFNPFVWLSSRFIRIEREHDCDDLVVKFTGTPLTYAHALLKIEILKEKDTPALSLAASGNSQHLYHRIKRITDMKTTYMSAKQRIFAISLTLGTIISLAWVSPAKDKETVKTAAADVVRHFTLDNVQAMPKIDLPIDTPPQKKKKVKIITVDEKGNKKEYNAVSELPDSLRIEEPAHVYRFKSDGYPMDSTTVISLRRNAESIRKHFDSPEEKAKWEKLALEMQKKGEAFAKRFNSPEERAKWEKLGLEMQKRGEVFTRQFSSPEEQEKRKALTEKMKKHAEEMRLKMNSPEHREEMKKLNEEMRESSKELQRMMISPEIENQLKNLNLNFKFDTDANESIALRNSEEYKKLKKEFEEKVEKLKKKQEKRKS